MKFIQIACFALTISVAIGCKDRKTDTPAAVQQEMGTLPDTPSDTIAPDEDKTPEMAYTGTYSGTLPCPTINCKGTDMSIILGDGNTYTLNVQDKGREDKPRKFEGTYTLNDSIITLDAEGDHLKFRVYNDSLKKLDKFGNPEQYGNPEGYILKKN